MGVGLKNCLLDWKLAIIEIDNVRDVSGFQTTKDNVSSQNCIGFTVGNKCYKCEQLPQLLQLYVTEPKQSRILVEDEELGATGIYFETTYSTIQTLVNQIEIVTNTNITKMGFSLYYGNELYFKASNVLSQDFSQQYVSCICRPTIMWPIIGILTVYPHFITE